MSREPVSHPPREGDADDRAHGAVRDPGIQVRYNDRIVPLRPASGGLPSRIALAAFGIALALCGLEIAVRIVAAFDRNYLDEVVNRRAGWVHGEMALVDLIRQSSDDRVVYELRPNLRGHFLGKRIRINSLGMRGEERTLAKPAGTFRIVGLGDSHMFGWGVAQDDCFLARLERTLNERLKSPRFEVWNLAVPGYNAVQEVETFAVKADAIQPDLVIISFIGNDTNLPNFLAERPNLWTLRRSYLEELVRRRIALGDGKPLSPLDLVDQEETLPDIPPRYRALVGVENLFGAYRRLAEIAQRRGIAAVLLFNGNDPKGVTTMTKVANENGFSIVDPGPRVLRYLREHALSRNALAVSSADRHMNALGHRLIAEELSDALIALRSGAQANP